MSKYGVFPGPSTEKYGPGKTLYLGTFYAVLATLNGKPLMEKKPLI